MIILNDKTLSFYNGLLSDITTFDSLLADCCSMGEWKELILEYTFDEYDGSVYDTILGRDIYFNVGLFNNMSSNPSNDPSYCQGFAVNLSSADGVDVEMTVVANDLELAATLTNYKCYINTSDGIDFTIKLQFFMTMDLQGFLGNTRQINANRFLKDYKSNSIACPNPYDTSYLVGTNSVYSASRYLDTFIKIYEESSTTAYQYQRERIQFWGKFYNEDTFFTNPVFTIRDSYSNVITSISNEDCGVTFEIDYTDEMPAINPGFVAMLFRVDANNQYVDFVSNYDLSYVECDTVQTDNHIKQPTKGISFSGGSTFSGTFTIDGASLPYGSTWRMVAILYGVVGGQKKTASFLSDEYTVSRRPVVVTNPQDNDLTDWHTKEITGDNRNFAESFSGISYILERISFNCLSVFNPALNAGHPYASVAGFETYLRRFRARIYRNDGVYKHTYAEQFYTYIALPPATGNAGVNDSDYDQTIELGDIPVYPYLKNWVAATNISNGYFMDWAIRSRAENSVSVHNKYLPSDMNDVNTWLNAQSSNDVQDWGDKTFGIDYTYFFTWPDGSQEVVTNSFDDVITIKDFDNVTASPQDIVIASIKDSLGEDLNIRKYICDSDADLVPDIDANGNEQLWLPVYAYLDTPEDGGAFSLMLSQATSTPSSVQEVNDTTSPVGVDSDLEPLLMIPQITDPTLVRNVNGWTTIGADSGAVYFELNIKKLVEGVDYKLYVVHTLNIET